MKVLNKHHFKKKDLPEDTIYIGRGSKWGNPFSHLENTLAKFKVESREEAINSYEKYLLSNQSLMSDITELSGKNLLCFCSPKPCHGDILLKLANQESEQ